MFACVFLRTSHVVLNKHVKSVSIFFATNSVYSGTLFSFSSVLSLSPEQRAEVEHVVHWSTHKVMVVEQHSSSKPGGKSSGFTRRWSSLPSTVDKQWVDGQHFNFKWSYLGWKNWSHASQAQCEMRILFSLALKRLPSYQWSVFSSLSNHSLC